MEDDHWILKMVKETVKLERTKMEEKLSRMEEDLQETLKLARIELEHRFEQFETDLLTKARILRDLSAIPQPKTMELQFSNKISQSTLTGEVIKGGDGTRIEVALLDSTTQERVFNIEPIASSSVEIVVLEGGADDWGIEEFNGKIVRVDGKSPLLEGSVCKLEGGIGVLENLKFRHYATKVKPSEFRLGARMVDKFDGIIVKEAKTESFVVRCYRNKYSKKKEIPDLGDEICVLKNIQKRGNIYKRLLAKGLNTVEKFLIQLLIDHQELKNISGYKGKKWEGTVSHAKKCQSDRMYCYMNTQELSAVVFDIFGNLQGLCSEGHYAAAHMLSENKKVYADRLVSYALDHWENVTPFDDPNSLQEHISAIQTTFNLSNSDIPEHPNTDTEARDSEMINESVYQEYPSPLSDTEILVAGIGSSGHHDLFGVDDHVDYSKLDLGDSDIGWAVYGYGMQQQSPIDDMNDDAMIDGSDIMLAESEFVLGSTAWRKPRMLFHCLSRWLSARKEIEFEASPAPKKQRVR